ncbi:hypothetical protein GCM10023201_35890 [Actinomycetospora corticicola]|uniref:Uncharacterized protein n=1 Tax=Actinomycetospora corticicola TaxID=663602 RepID=A0A7Y9J863_9PSEU|nr:hypothetical protein [Actinomycetospora corticicola]NYD38978.1 hypothetical protein [Actinomycetospora corticicola]
MRGDPEDLLGALDHAIRPIRPPNPVVALYRWRYELGLVVGAVAIAPTIAALTPAFAVGITALAVLPLGIPQVRHLVWLRVRAVVLQHRLRTAFRAARIHSNSGRIPAILWTSPRTHADRVRLFLPAGLTPELLEGQTDRIAVATGGAYAEVLPTRYRFVVKLVIVRSP